MLRHRLRNATGAVAVVAAMLVVLPAPALAANSRPLWVDTITAGTRNTFAVAAAVDPTSHVEYTLARVSPGDLLLTATAADGTRLWQAGIAADVTSGNFGDVALNAATGTVYVIGNREFGIGVLLALSPDGAPLWRTSFTGFADTLAVDSNSGQVYVAGETVGGTTRPDLLVVAYSAAGRQLWSTTYDGPAASDDYARGAAVNPADGTVYVTAASAGRNRSYDWATLAITPLGQRTWVSRYDGPTHSTDEPMAITVDPQRGRLVVTGNSYNGEISDTTTIAYNLQGTALWLNQYPGTRNDGGKDVAVAAASGAAYVAGVTAVSGSGEDTVTLAYAADGTPLWTSVYDVPSGKDDQGTGVEVDPTTSEVLVAGRAEQSVHLLTYTPSGRLVDTDRFGTRPLLAEAQPDANAYVEEGDLVVDPGTGTAYLAVRMSGSPSDDRILATTIAYSR